MPPLLTSVPQWWYCYPTSAHTNTHNNQVAQTQAHEGLVTLSDFGQLKLWKQQLQEYRVFGRRSRRRRRREWFRMCKHQHHIILPVCWSWPFFNPIFFFFTFLTYQSALIKILLIYLSLSYLFLLSCKVVWIAEYSPSRPTDYPKIYLQGS